MRESIKILGSGLFFACVLLVIPYVSSAADCPAGTSPATANDAAVKNGQIAIGACYNPNTPGVGATAENAKQYLKSLPRSGSASDNGNIEKLNTAMAVCSANFFKAFQDQYGGISITSAYRSSQYDAQMCRNNPSCGALMNNPNPNGNHQKGLAIDVKASAGQEMLWNFARQNPQLGVCFPFTGEGGGFRDTVHMILAGIPGNETRGPGCRGVTKACEAGKFDPNSIVAATPTPGNGAPTGAPFDQALRDLLNPQPYYCVTSIEPVVVVPSAVPPGPNCYNSAQRPQLPPPTTSPAATQPAMSSGQSAPPVGVVNSTALPLGACAPQFYCIGNINYYRTSTCIDQVYQTCPNGCSGTMCVNSASSTNSNSNTNGTSTYDSIGQYVDSGSSASATITPITLNPNTSNPTVLQPPQTPQGIGYVPTNTEGQISPAQQTFTSGDLSGSLPYQASQSGFATTLNNIKSTLLNILAYLKPFGGMPTSQMYLEY